MFTPNDRIFKKRRKALIELLKEKGIQDQRVLSAIESVPRHLLIDTALHNRAYEDTALPIALRQTISQPYTVARQTELLMLSGNEKVLEIGTGSGYQCAILCEIVKQVYSIERHFELYDLARTKLQEMGYRPMLKCDDGTLGWSAYAPYDAIVVTAGAPIIPDHLKLQLTVGGRLVIPVGDRDTQAMVRVTRVSKDHFQEEKFDNFKFVPLVGKRGWR